MRTMFEVARDWADTGHRFACATIVAAEGSSPRPIGTVMLVRNDGMTFGSLSSGCIEAEVVSIAQDVIATERARQIQFSEVDHDDVWTVGLTCGGKISVFVEVCPLLIEHERETWNTAAKLSDTRKRYVWNCTLSEKPEHFVEVSDSVEGRTSIVNGVFRDVRNPRPRLIIIGAVQIADHLVGFANALGFETIVVDPRTPGMVQERFQNQPELAKTAWPSDLFRDLQLDRDCFVVALTHDPKIDDDALDAALRSEAQFIGALGGSRSHSQRCERLSAKGHTFESLARIHGPVGLPLGARSAEDIALSIIAQIVQIRNA